MNSELRLKFGAKTKEFEIKNCRLYRLGILNSKFFNL